MATEEKAKLVFIPFPMISHLVSAVKAASLLADSHAGLSIDILVMNPSLDTKITSFTANSPNPRVTFVHLPRIEPDPTSKLDFISRFIVSQKPVVRAAAGAIASESDQRAGFVLDMFCTSMIDVADELGSPSYVYFSCGSANLGLFFQLQSLRDDGHEGLKEYLNSDAAIEVPTFVNRVPARVWPSSVFEDDDGLLNVVRDFRRTKGILVNSFLEFETHAINSLAADANLPPVFPVGPILQSVTGSDRIDEGEIEIIEWLNQQPDSSVVYLCFGSAGSFDRNQVTEIARALEKIGGIRFLWSLRRPPPEGSIFSGDYENPAEVLPEGFLERTAGVGKVVGWSPQMAVLSHVAVGGFVSHGGWNSTLESIWCGVPMAVWPLYAEQQANAFQLVVELGTAVEVKMDYRPSSGEVVPAETIEAAVRKLMDPRNAIREKVRTFSEKSRRALLEGDSSHQYLQRFIGTVLGNISLNH